MQIVLDTGERRGLESHSEYKSYISDQLVIALSLSWELDCMY